jgi:Ni,Fe-hydrogenase maturation factor
MRGGDSVGPMAVQRVGLYPAWAADPIDLLDQISNLEAVVIIDAALGPDVGQVDVWTLSEAKGSILPDKGVSHILGLREALLLAEVLDGLPSFFRLVTVGIGGADWGTEVDGRILLAVEQAAATAECLLEQALVKEHQSP